MNPDDDHIQLTDDDEIVLVTDTFDELGPKKPNLWKVMVVDDEADIHTLTTMVTRNLKFLGRNIELINAYSGAEARRLLVEHPDVALVLLDVVMETEHEGLDVARYIREELGNKNVRIVLRTGQPGQAPELETVVNYDINDYKEKTELTTTKLCVAIHTALRCYRDIVAIEYTKQNLEKILRSTHELYHNQAIREFAEHVLEQLTMLLHLGRDALYYKLQSDEQQDIYLGKEILVGIGEFAQYTDLDHSQLPVELHAELERIRNHDKIILCGDHYMAYFQSPHGSEHILYVRGSGDIRLSETDMNLIYIFCHHVGKAFDTFAPKQQE